MMSYEELLAELYARSDEKYRAFHFSLLNNKNLKLMLDKDIWATNIYTIGYEYDSWNNLDFTKKIVTI